ncbi:c6 zinc finger domain containing protein [Colletotrichum sp. SAR 10_76]|nr:c6 zinc finger domain containing protein [Colletotrichum sp. SAR 10_76]
MRRPIDAARRSDNPFAVHALAFKILLLKQFFASKAVTRSSYDYSWQNCLSARVEKAGGEMAPRQEKGGGSDIDANSDHKAELRSVTETGIVTIYKPSQWDTQSGVSFRKINSPRTLPSTHARPC